MRFHSRAGSAQADSRFEAVGQLPSGENGFAVVSPCRTPGRKAAKLMSPGGLDLLIGNFDVLYSNCRMPTLA